MTLGLTPLTPGALPLTPVGATNLPLAQSSTVNVTDGFGVVANGVTDDTTAINRALASGKQAVYFPPLHYFCAGQVSVPAGVSIYAYGATFSSSLASGRVVSLDGTVGSSLALTADTAAGDLTVSLSAPNAAMLAAGDHVRVSDSTSLAGALLHDEQNIVFGVSGTTVTLKYPLNFAYVTSQTANVQKVTPIADSHWYGGTFDLSGVSGETDAIQATFAYGCTIEDVLVKHHTGKAVQFWQSLACSTQNVRAENPSAVTAGLGYGVQFIYGRFCNALNTYGESCRHITDISGGSDNLISGVFGGGRTTDVTTAAFLHGLSSRRCHIENVQVANTDFGIAAGNGTFGADYDFTFDGYQLSGCNDGIFVTQGCSGFTVGTGNVHGSVARGVVIDQTCTDWMIDGAMVDTTGSYGLDVAAAAGKRGKVQTANILNTGSYSIRVTGAGTITLGDGVQVDHTAGSVTINTASFTGKLFVNGGDYTQNAGNFDIVSLAGAAALYRVCGARILGINTTAASSGVKATGGTVVIVRDCYMEGCAETIRLEVDGKVFNNELKATSNAIRLAGSCANAYLNDDVFLAGTHISNTASATITGNDT